MKLEFKLFRKQPYFLPGYGSGLMSFDLMLRVARADEAEAGLRLVLHRIATLAGLHRLWELAEAVNAEAERSEYVDRFARWCAVHGTR